ncbi:hypothetical protein CMUS01_10650 [Colletotrichum musicola]|uniref:Uncharacterized protein n=1 Tax=Colletotrichum musicola TaxID=2175873 RepID=A0A8H6K2Z5_9PEZI|nr:hypothetical protein CMUS01_10650 [Colletotrichum musicola]
MPGLRTVVSRAGKHDSVVCSEDVCTNCRSVTSSSWISSTADHPPVKMIDQFYDREGHATGGEEDGYYEIDSDYAFPNGSATTLSHAPSNMPAPAANMAPAVNPSSFNVEHLDPALFGFERFPSFAHQPPQTGPINGAIPIAAAYNNPGPMPTNGHIPIHHPGPRNGAIPIASAYNNPGPMPTNGHVLTDHPGSRNGAVPIVPAYNNRSAMFTNGHIFANHPGHRNGAILAAPAHKNESPMPTNGHIFTDHPGVPIDHPDVPANSDDESPVSGSSNDEIPFPLVSPGPPCRQVNNRWYCGRCSQEKSRKDEMRRHLRRDHYLEYYPGSFTIDHVNYKEALRRARIDCP